MFLLYASLFISYHIGEIVANLVLISFFRPDTETLFIDFKDL